MLHPLEILKDRISKSKTHNIGRFINETELNLLKEYVPHLDDYISKLSHLYLRLWSTLNILDYDDTLQHRHYQLQMWILQDNRWKEGNRVIDEVIGREKMLDLFYKRASIVSRIAQILEMQDDTHVARILTAGSNSWQEQKTRESWVYDRKNGIIVVDEAKWKIQKLLDTIIELWYIPKKIIIYEDRPEHFIKTAEITSKFLGWVEIVINHVILSQREVIKKQIEEIRQNIYVQK